MRPRPRPETREGMNAASGTAARQTLTTGRNRTHNRIPAQAPGSRFPRPHHRAPGQPPQGRLRRRRWRPGSRPVPDPAARSPRTWQLPGNSRRQSRTPAPSQNHRKTPLTRPRPFRDENRQVLLRKRDAACRCPRSGRTGLKMVTGRPARPEPDRRRSSLDRRDDQPPQHQLPRGPS